jgi:acyl-CoA synthetase (AMP-forming)/AMP-acid ligase II
VATSTPPAPPATTRPAKARLAAVGRGALPGPDFGLPAGSRFCATVPSHHIYGLLYSVLAPLLCGASFLRETPFYAETVVGSLERFRCDVLVTVPATCAAWRSSSACRPCRAPSPRPGCCPTRPRPCCATGSA